MKKLLFLAAFAFLAFAVQAQFGLKAGVNFANLGGDDVDSDGKKANVQLYFGAYYNIALSDNISLQPELVYSGQGAKWEEGGDKAKLNLAYLNFTPLFRYNFPGGFFVGMAPQVGFLSSAKWKYDGEEIDVKDDVKSIDFSGALALGYMLPNGFGFYARYAHGFTSIDKEDSDSKIFNRVFSVGLRYNIGGSKDGGEGGKSKK
jgi:hypothetical protein